MIKHKLFAACASLLIGISLTGCASKTSDQRDSQSDQAGSQDGKLQAGTSAVNTSAGGELRAYFLDVGQGDSIYIRTPRGQSVLIDGGNNDQGERLVNYLKSLNVKQIDALVATHPDADHIGGLDNVLKNIKVQNVYTPKITHTTKTYEDFVLAVKNQGLKFKEAKAGVSLGLDGVEAHFTGPVKQYGTELNDWSAVLKVTYGKNSFLFTGDAPTGAEQDMINARQDLRADVLKVGHHGAKTSTSQAFLDAVKPKYAVISVGADNKYGHPTAEVLNRLTKSHIETFRTDQLGTVVAISNGETISFAKQKNVQLALQPIHQ